MPLQLALWNATRNNLAAVRPLTSKEVRFHKHFTPIVGEARNRLALFRLLTRNYDEWRRYLDQLLNTSFKSKADIAEELNRLLLNYLTLAYAIREHFEISFRQRFKKDQQKIKEYEDFVLRLCKVSWACAFIWDFRGYVQHRGLPVSINNRVISETSVRIIVKANARQLLAESRNWKYSQLTGSHKMIDLVAIIKEFQVQMLQSYAPYVAKVFIPELKPASEFYKSLTVEALAKDPSGRMVFLKREPKTVKQTDGKISVKVQVIDVPNDVYGGLGINIIKEEPAATK